MDALALAEIGTGSNQGHDYVQVMTQNIPSVSI